MTLEHQKVLEVFERLARTPRPDLQSSRMTNAATGRKKPKYSVEPQPDFLRVAQQQAKARKEPLAVAIRRLSKAFPESHATWCAAQAASTAAAKRTAAAERRDREARQ